MKKRASKKPDFPKVIETFTKPDNWHTSSLLCASAQQPSCFNGLVSIRRYRVTLEEIEESREVLIERLAKLWQEFDNVHHYQPLKRAAEELGVELVGPWGKDKSDKRTVKDLREA